MLRLASVKVVVDVIKKYQEKTAELSEEKAGTPSAQSCPECHGVLWESEEGATLKFRCRVGHSVSADSMLEDQGVDVERALWAALRVQATREAHSEGTRRETTNAA